MSTTHWGRAELTPWALGFYLQSSQKPFSSVVELRIPTLPLWGFGVIRPAIHLAMLRERSYWPLAPLVGGLALVVNFVSNDRAHQAFVSHLGLTTHLPILSGLNQFSRYLKRYPACQLFANRSIACQ